MRWRDAPEARLTAAQPPPPGSRHYGRSTQYHPWMNNSAPANELDRAIMAVQRSKAGLPELYRQLAAGELWFLIPYHPEIEGDLLELKNGSPLPFASLTDQHGEVVPLFSSEARVEEALEKGH